MIKRGRSRAILNFSSNTKELSANSKELRLKKKLSVLGAIILMVAGIIWGGFYLFFDEPWVALIPCIYSLTTLVNILFFSYYQNYPVFSFIQLFLIAILPFFVNILLGGIIASSAVIVWLVFITFMRYYF